MQLQAMLTCVTKLLIYMDFNEIVLYFIILTMLLCWYKLDAVVILYCYVKPTINNYLTYLLSYLV